MFNTKRMWVIDIEPIQARPFLIIKRGSAILRFKNPAEDENIYPAAFETPVNALLYLTDKEPNISFQQAKLELMPVNQVTAPEITPAVAVIRPLAVQCPHCKRMTIDTIVKDRINPVPPNVICPYCKETFRVAKPSATQQTE